MVKISFSKLCFLINSKKYSSSNLFIGIDIDPLIDDFWYSSSSLTSMRSILFPNNYYGRPIIGWKHEIEKLNHDDVINFYKNLQVYRNFYNYLFPIQ